MSPSSSSSLWQARLTAISALLLGLFACGGLLTQDLAAQKARPKPEEEEEPAKKPVKKGEEEEDTKRPKLKPPLRIEDPDPKEAKRVDLAAEATLAEHPAVKDLYHRLALEHDEANFPAPRAMQPIEPVPQFVGPQPLFDGKISIHHIDAKGVNIKDEEVTRKALTGIDHYESLAMAQVDRFLERVKEDPKMPRPEALMHATKVLQLAVEFHDSARQSGKRKGSGWAPVEQRLRAKLRDIRLERLAALVEAKRWPEAHELATQLGSIEEYRRDDKVTGAIIQARAREVARGIDEDNLDTFVEARKQLEELERQIPDARNHEAVKRLRDRLQEKAAAALRKARDLAKKDPKSATTQLKTVENICPQLPGVQDLRQELRPYKPIGVGVRTLPKYLTPATAATDSERQGMELIFESLLRPIGDPLAGQRYEPLLASGFPRMVPLGRQFQLVTDAHWYRAGRTPEETIDEPVRATDVRSTVKLYQDWPGHSPEWDLLTEPRVDADPYCLNLNLKQGCLDPLSLMTFKVLPAKYMTRADDRVFAEKPVGSGPYQYLGIKQGNRGDYAQFLANPTYGRRAGKQDLPRVQAIHFYETRIHGRDGEVKDRDLAHEFKSGEMQLLLDLPTSRIKQLESDAAGLKGLVKIQTLRNRRVWFLAVNHRDKRLQNDDLRRALALAIDREKILNDWFRDDYRDERGNPVHRALNSLYPAGSWACDPNRPADPYKPATAKSLVKELAKKTTLPELTLIFPNDLPGVEDSCDAIAKQAKEVGLTIKPKGMPLAEVHDAVVRDHKYELAYFYWDHPSDAYWLGPLFDKTAAENGGPNFLGPVNDGILEGLFNEVRQHRDFKTVQEYTRQIHQRLYDRMPVIPLWQLDTHIAVHRDLKMGPGDVDPLRIFTNVEQWQLEK